MRGSVENVKTLINKDEVKHGQIGWFFLSVETSINSCEYISEYLPEMLEISINDDLFLPRFKSDGISGPIAEGGVLPFHFRIEQLRETFNLVIVPGFKKFGINTSLGEAWLNKKLLHSSVGEASPRIT